MFVLCALALSLARAAWVGFFVGAGFVVLLYLVLRRRTKDVGRRATADSGGLRVGLRRGLPVGGLAVAGALAFLPTVAPVLFPGTAWGVLVRVNPAWYDPAKDPSVTVRVSATKSALDDIGAHPIIGNGAGSYGVTHTGEGGAPGWISNLELHILYDSGAVGLLVFAAGIGWLAWRGLRQLFAGSAGDSGDDMRPQIVGLLGAIAVLLIAFQATEGTWMAFFWGYVGLLAAAAIKRKDQTAKAPGSANGRQGY
jgi:O-antigen ligase